MSTSFSSLGLSENLQRAVADQGYTEPTPIQAQSIPVILQGGDLLASAQTGTGKTAAFTLPILQKLAAQAPPSPRHPRALVLVPTRELAAQVLDSVRAYGAHAGLKSCSIFGGVNIRPQIDIMRKGVDILVATPGRLLDHWQQRTVNFSQIQVLVLDEADRMLDMGFIRDIRKILGVLPKERQNLLFSATFSNDIRQLADGLLRNPAKVEVARRNAPAEAVAQRLYKVDKSRKKDLLAELIHQGGWTQTLVFVRTKHGANRLAEQLTRDGIVCAALHGNKSQNARTRALADFKDGRVRVLVATDIAARGLDIELLPHVVNYELPNVPEDYVHRIGRTGRAGAVGEAISLVSQDERDELRGIQKLLGREIPESRLEGFDLQPRPQQHQPQRQHHHHQQQKRHGHGQPHGHRGGGSPQGQKQHGHQGQKPHGQHSQQGQKKSEGQAHGHTHQQNAQGPQQKSEGHRWSGRPHRSAEHLLGRSRKVH